MLLTNGAKAVIKSFLRFFNPATTLQQCGDILLTLSPTLAPFLFPATLSFAGSQWHIYAIALFVFWQLAIIELHRATSSDQPKAESPSANSKKPFILALFAMLVSLLLIATIKETVQQPTFYLLLGSLTCFPLHVLLQARGHTFKAFLALVAFFLSYSFLCLSLHFGSWSWQAVMLAGVFTAIASLPWLDRLLDSLSIQLPAPEASERTRHQRKLTRKILGNLPVKTVVLIFNITILLPPALLTLLVSFNQLPKMYLLAAILLALAVRPLQQAQLLKQGERPSSLYISNGTLYGLASLVTMLVLRLLSW